jgi:hypothetical protein
VTYRPLSTESAQEPQKASRRSARPFACHLPPILPPRPTTHRDTWRYSTDTSSGTASNLRHSLTHAERRRTRRNGFCKPLVVGANPRRESNRQSLQRNCLSQNASSNTPPSPRASSTRGEVPQSYQRAGGGASAAGADAREPHARAHWWTVAPLLTGAQGCQPHVQSIAGFPHARACAGACTCIPTHLLLPLCRISVRRWPIPVGPSIFG